MEPVVLATGWVLAWVLLWRIPRVRGADAGVARVPATTWRPTVSVVVPARDEERNLPALLESLRRQRRAPLEVLVVDDGSTDATAAVARAGGATVLAAGAMPDGWTGKSWACWQGTRRARGDVLVLLDADVTLDPGALDALVRRQARSGGLLSVQPHHEVRRPYEWLSAIFNIVAFMGVGAASLLRPRRVRAAFGPCLVCRAEDYRAVDGHRSVRGEIVEDVALGRRFADADHPVTLLGGGRLVRFRMYPDGVGQLVEGWTKNIASGAAGSPVLRAVGAFLWVTAALTAGGMVAGAVLGSAPAGAAVLVYAAFVVQFGVLARQVGTFPVWSWLVFPLLAAFFVLVFVRSMVLTLVTRRVVWRGRSIPLSRPRRWAPERPGSESSGRPVTES